MRSSQVYQPTTTTINYDRHKAWVPSFLANSSSSSTWSRTVMLSLSVLFAIMGLVMIIVGATSYNAIEEGSFTEDNATAYIIILCVGILLEIAAITALIMYYRTLGYYIPCCPGKIARIRKRLHENQMVVNGQVVNVGEPVSAQYCPPAQPVVGSTPPPPYTDISEEQRLMDEKPDIGLPMGGVCDVKPYHHHHYSPLMCLVFRSDDTERILEEDPRIVLTPLKSQEEC